MAPGSGRRLPIGFKGRRFATESHLLRAGSLHGHPVVNGTAYPYLAVEPKAYRFRILNACNDRNLNLSLFTDASGGGSGATATATLGTGALAGTVASIARDEPGGTGYTSPPGVFILGGGPGVTALATAVANLTGGIVTSITVTYGGDRLYLASHCLHRRHRGSQNGSGVPTTGFPAAWPTDGRAGGVPDPARAGPR